MATGSLAIPVKLPAPYFGTAEQAARTAWSACDAESGPSALRRSGAARRQLRRRRRGGGGVAAASRGQRHGHGEDGQSEETNLHDDLFGFSVCDRTGCGSGAGSSDGHRRTECQPVAPSGNGAARCWVCVCAGRVGGADFQRVAAGGGLPVQVPLAPGVRIGRGGQPGLPPGAAVHPDLDGGDATCWAQAIPAIVTGPAASRAKGLGTSMRDAVLTAPCWPSHAGPVGVVRRRTGELDVGHPLGGRDVAVEAGNDHAGREAVHQGQGSPFMPTASSASRPSSTADRACRRSSRPPTRRIWSASGPDPGLARAGRPGRRRASARCRRKGRRPRWTRTSGDVPLHQRPDQQVVEGQLDRPVDQAVDAQHPVLGAARWGTTRAVSTR